MAHKHARMTAVLAMLMTAALTACTTSSPHGESTGSGSAGSGSGSPCSTDADCPQGETCVETGTGEISTKQCEPSGGSGTTTCDPTTDPSCAIDPTCSSAPGTTFYPPYVPLVPDSVPASCANGFEINNSYPLVYTIDASTAAGARAITLDVDIATYVEPNRITIRGVAANGQSYVLLDTCRMQTWDQPDPTNGTTRPPDVTIRQFKIDVTPGTTRLAFDFSSSECSTPFYLRVVGLCDFTMPNPWAADASKIDYWRAVN